jgi:nucleoside-diphosphate-sugar epimerase
MHELIVRGHCVRMVSRNGKMDSAPAAVELVAGDATDPAFAAQVSRDADVVYNCLNAPYTEWPVIFPSLQKGVLAGAMASDGKKLVVMENLYMYGPTGGKLLTEDLPYNATGRKGITRARMSEELMEAHESGKLKVAMARASDFYGPYCLASAAGEMMFGNALSGKAAQIVGRLDLPHTYTYLEDVGKALAILGERHEAYGQVWHIPAAETVATRRFIEMIFEEIDTPPKMAALPGWAASLIGLFVPIIREVAEMAYEFEEPFIVDDSKFQRTFSMPTTPLKDAIRRTVAWYKDHYI